MNEILTTMVAQIGRINLLAASGGRVLYDNANLQIQLPVGSGYRVLVTYDEGSDTYTVERVFVRRGEFFDHGRQTYVHCDELGETVYQASCYRNVDFGVREPT